MLFSKTAIALICVFSAVSCSLVTGIIVSNLAIHECSVGKDYLDQQFRSRTSTRGPSEGF